MKNISFKILFVSLLSSIGYSCCFYKADAPGYTYELVYENKVPNAIYFSDGKKIIDSIPANRNKIYYDVNDFIFQYDTAEYTNRDLLYKMLSVRAPLFVKIQNRCIQNKNDTAKIKGSPLIGDEIKDRCNKFHYGIRLGSTNGTHLYDYRRYTYIPDSRASGGRGYIVYTFTASDTVGSVKCNF